MSTIDENKVTIPDLYPDLTSDEQTEAEENLRRYLVVVRQIFQTIVDGKPKILTELRKRASLRKRGNRF